ncbi:MAG: transporter, partial [Acidobacteria bacterium]
MVRSTLLMNISGPRPPDRKLLLGLWLSSVLSIASPSVWAQASEATEAPKPGPIVTDRPTDSASPLLVPRRTFQLEAGYKFSRIDNDPGSTDVQVLPDLLARFGINSKVEARLVAAGWTFQSGADDKATAFSDISLGAKIHLADEHERRPQMALLVDVSLPVGHSDYTSDYVIPKVLFLGSNALDGGLGLTYNV